jgi:hypothetical protein
MKRLLVLLVIAVLAGGAWLYLNQERFFPKPVAKEVSPQRWQVGDARTNPAETPPLFNATNETLTDNATAASNATQDGNATQTPPAADEIVRLDFVEDASAYLVSRYLPGGTKKNPESRGRFDLNVKSVNIRYGVDFPGLNVDPADILGARRIVFDHILQGPVLEYLHAAYTPLFLDSLERALQGATHTLTSGQSAAITPEQRAEMLGLLAARLQAIGKTVVTLATTDSIRPLVGKYLEDTDKVSEAHLAFWNLQTAKASLSATNEAGTRIKTTIQTREISRQRLLQTIVGAGAPQGMDASELVYLAQWVYRRGLENPHNVAAVAKVGDLLIRVADAVEERSRQPRPDLEERMDGNGTTGQQ